MKRIMKCVPKRWILLFVGLVLVSVGFSRLLPLAPAMAEPETDNDFINMIESHSSRYFWQEADAETGLIKDSSYSAAPCSVSALGVGIASLCVAAERGWISQQEAYFRILKALRTMRDKSPHVHGFYYRFIDPGTGRRVWSSEISTLDTAVFIAGALVAAEYFPNSPVETMANEIYERVNWAWMADPQTGLLAVGWKPESGFLSYRWNSYNEGILIYALAIGSPSHALKPAVWNRIEHPEGSYPENRDNFIYARSGSLIAYQLPHAFIDFRNMTDRRGVNYHENSAEAIRAQRRFCIDQSEKHQTYGSNGWGLTASMGPEGYRGYGGRPGNALHDGTIAPSAVAGSIPFTPYESIQTLRSLYRAYESQGERLYDGERYGFKDALNKDKNWVSPVYLGMNQGITVLMIENYRTSFVWRNFMRHPAAKKFVKSCFVQTQKESDPESAVPQEIRGGMRGGR